MHEPSITLSITNSIYQNAISHYAPHQCVTCHKSGTSTEDISFESPNGGRRIDWPVRPARRRFIGGLSGNPPGVTFGRTLLSRRIQSSCELSGGWSFRLSVGLVPHQGDGKCSGGRHVVPPRVRFVYGVAGFCWCAVLVRIINLELYIQNRGKTSAS